MRKLVRGTVYIMLLTVFSVGLFVQSGAAQDQGRESLTLSPAVARPLVKPGQVIQDKLTVINDGQTDYRFIVYARPYSVNDEDYSPNYTTVNERTEAYQWVTFDQTQYTLKAGERIEVPYTLAVPDNVKGGGNYAVLFAETQPDTGDEVANVARKKRVGMLIYAEADGDIVRSGKVESFETPLLHTKRPVVSHLRIKNDGNTHFRADLKARYKSLLGSTKFELNQELLILPGTTRKIPVSWQNAPYIGIFKTDVAVSFLDNTEKLPTKWVILMPVPAMVAFGVVVTAVAVALLITKRKRGVSSVKKSDRKQ